MEQLIGQIIDRYRVDRLLGEGMLGNVYQGQDINLDRVVAIKVIKPDFINTPGFATGFVSAARALGRLEERGLVRVLDFGHTDRRSYVIMDFVEGPTLAQLLFAMHNSQQWIALPEALQCIQQIGRVVDYLQRQAAQRRRLLPTKITLKRGSENAAPAPDQTQVILMDLGLHSLLASSIGLTNRLRQEGLAYLSPEEVLGDVTDNRSDVYALGALAFELITGQPCLVAHTLGEAVDAHLNHKAMDVRAIHPALPEPLAATIEKALARAPADRYATAGALLNALAVFSADRLPALLPPCATLGATTLQAQLARPTPVLGPAQAEMPPVEEPGPAMTMVPGMVSATAPGPAMIDQLRILAPKGVAQTMIIEKTSLSIGRTPDNDLILDDPRVSRKHARLELDSNGWHVVDLNSANGTFIAKTRLPPGSTSKIDYDTPVRVGDHYLRITQEQDLRPAPAPIPVQIPPAIPTPPAKLIYIPSIGAEVDRSHILSSADGLSAGLFLAETKYNVEPGKRIAIPIVLLNQKPMADAFMLAVKGVPPAWLRLPMTRVELGPGEQRQVVLEIEPMRAPQTKVKSYAIRLDVASQNVPDQVASGEIKVNVRRYVQFQVELKPQRVQIGEPIQVSILNQGNALQLFTVYCSDKSDKPDELIFEPSNVNLELSPGQTGAVKFTAMMRKPRLLGAAHQHWVQIQISPQFAQVELHRVEVISRGRIPIG